MRTYLKMDDLLGRPWAVCAEKTRLKKHSIRDKRHASKNKLIYQSRSFYVEENKTSSLQRCQKAVPSSEQSHLSGRKMKAIQAPVRQSDRAGLPFSQRGNIFLRWVNSFPQLIILGPSWAWAPLSRSRSPLTTANSDLASDREAVVSGVFAF